MQKNLLTNFDNGVNIMTEVARMQQHKTNREVQKMNERKTLEQILETEKAHRSEGGAFGIQACKESIQFDVDFFGRSLDDLLEEYIERANDDIFFNRAMVLAC